MPPPNIAWWKRLAFRLTAAVAALAAKRDNATRSKTSLLYDTGRAVISDESACVRDASYGTG